DDAGERADQPPKARDGRARHDAAKAAAGHHQLAAAFELDGLWRPRRIAEPRAAAGRTLRTRPDIVLHDGGAQEIETDDVIVQIGAKVGGDRLGDLHRGKLDTGVADRLPRQGGNRHRPGLAAVEHPLDLAVAHHARRETGPAGALAGPEYGAHQGKD